MTLEQLKDRMEQFLQAIHEYKNSPDYNETDLEYCVIDPVLCRLPRDIVYVEWYDRSDIKNMADGVFDEPPSEDLVDTCMHDLWGLNQSVMDNEIVQDCVSETVRFAHKTKEQ